MIFALSLKLAECRKLSTGGGLCTSSNSTAAVDELRLGA